MAIDTSAPRLKVVLESDGMELDLPSLQGFWSEEQYLKLTDYTNQLIEFTDGSIEVLPIATDNHQTVCEVLFVSLRAFLRPLGGKVRFSPLRLRLCPGKYREPDILLMRDAHDPRRQNRYWLGADLVVEIVSDDNPERDTQVKRVEYAEADILEYWIVNPLDETITVLTLAGDAYAEHGMFRRGEIASSRLLDSFTVSVDEVFDAD